MFCAPQPKGVVDSEESSGEIVSLEDDDADFAPREPRKKSVRELMKKSYRLR